MQGPEPARLSRPRPARRPKPRRDVFSPRKAISCGTEAHTINPIRKPLLLAAALTVLLGATGLRAAAAPTSGQAIGTVKYKDKTVALQHAYLIAADKSGTKVRLVILSAVDIKDKITAASSLMSASAKLREGISFELDETMPFVGYWMAIADQSMQMSAPLDVKLFLTTASTPQRVAGKVSFDQSESGGPKVEATFDAALTKSFP